MYRGGARHRECCEERGERNLDLKGEREQKTKRERGFSMRTFRQERDFSLALRKRGKNSHIPRIPFVLTMDCAA